MITPTYFPKKKKAFALLMSLFLMSFLVLLVITLSAIVQMELKSSRQTLLDQKAKNAAKFAAFQALAEVQKSLGPDQRISANAKILDTELNDVFNELEDDDSYAFWSYDPMFSRDEVDSIEGISNPLWLGVWDSTPGMHPVFRDSSESRVDYSDRVLAYATNFLVSGNRSIKREDIYPSDDLDLSYSPVDILSEDYINMLRKNSIVDENGDYNSDTMQVRVPLVTFPKTDEESSRSYLETRIAWWVSDESQKAPVNVLATEEEFSYAEEDESKKTLMQVMPFKNGMQALSMPNSSVGVFDVDLNEEADREYLRALNEVSQLDLLVDSSATNITMSKFLYNSVTMNTKGLAVNVRNGGLKKDLSVGLLARNPNKLDSDPDFFEKPIGVVGYDAYLSNPLDGNGKITPNVFSSNSLYGTSGELEKGHMFGPQAPDNISLTYKGLNYAINVDATDDVSTVHKDVGGPLWDSLRDYYNNRVDKDGLDAFDGSTSGSYANKVKTKTDVTTGLSPVLMHYQLFTYPTLSHYGDQKYGVRVYFIPLVVLWNPYDIDIEKNSTFAFKHGWGSPNVVGTFRVAIGIKNSTTDKFEAIRDIRGETMPRPLPNLADKNSYYTYMGGENKTGASYSFSDLYNYGEEIINAYRSVSWDSGTEKVLVISASEDGINDDEQLQSGDHDYFDYPINKSYYGYGNWRYEDTKSLVVGVEDSDYFPKGTSSIANSGLVRIYEKGEESSLSKTLTDGTSISVPLPDYYYLSTESFYYRKLYFNNLLYSLGYTGQIKLPYSGSLSSLTKSDMLKAMFEGGGVIVTSAGSAAESAVITTYSDESFRFLVRNEEALKAGEAKIFTLKESVPYHYTYDGEEGYAGNFAKAVENEWYLTEGVDTDSIGGFFVDILHPERTYLASVRDGNNYNGDNASRPTYDVDNYKNMIFDPKETCSYDKMELGVLFDLGEDRYYTYADDAGQSRKVTIDEISLDFDKWVVDIADISNGRMLFLPPLGYATAGSGFIPNPWRAVNSSLMKGHSTGLNDAKVYLSDTKNIALRQSELIMWNYNDDGDDIALYLSEDGNTKYGTYFTGRFDEQSAFQSLKRYALPKNPNTPLVAMQSFPDPSRIEDDYLSSSSKYASYFDLLAGMAAFPNGTSITGTASPSDGYENPASVEQNMFITSDTDSYYYGMNIDYTSSAATSTATLTSGIVRDKVRGKNFPMYNENGDTIFDGYYKNLMKEVNSRIENLGGTDADLYDVDSEEDYEEFLEALGLDEVYSNKSWVWEDPYFLLRNPRRISLPTWDLDPADATNDADKDLLWRDNLPQSFTVESAQIVNVSSSSEDTAGLKLSAITANEGRSLVFYEGVTAYRPVGSELEDVGSDADRWFYQYPFKFPWLTQSNVTAKMYGDGIYGNGGAFRDRTYGTESLRGGAATSCLFFAYGAMANNLQHSTYQFAGEEGTDGNFRMHDWFSFYIDRFSGVDDNVSQVQVGPDVMSEDGYEYALKHYLRKYETVLSLVDLSTADLAFGTEQNRSFGVGTATADMYYPNNLIGTSFAPMRIAPERYFDYLWTDSFTTSYTKVYNPSGDGLRLSTEIRQVIYDMAWHLNDLLWDEYFFSSIPYRDSEQDDIDDYYTYLVPKNPRIKYINANKDYLYVREDLTDGDNLVAKSNRIEDDSSLDSDYYANSARFWINGPFNVNSTNVDAWKMVLGTSFGNGVYGLDGSYNKADSNKAPMPRNSMPYTATEFDKDSVRDNEQLAMQGYRALSRADLEELALSMVENVKDRGPFYSLADFVNRSVELRSAEMIRMGTSAGNNAYDFSNDFWSNPESMADDIIENADEKDSGNFFLRQDHMQKGVLQSAIDLTAINQAFFDDAYLVDYDNDDAALNSKFTSISANNEFSMASMTWNVARDYSPSTQEAFWLLFGNPRNVWENYRAVLGSTLAGAPTYLTQVDILKQIGSFITVRGDTFKIRAYGEIRNPLTEEVESKAWCEMLVQRYPEYIDSSLNNATDINNREIELGDQGGSNDYDSLFEQLENNPVNKYLGRRFKVVSFKWLSEREI